MRIQSDPRPSVAGTMLAVAVTVLLAACQGEAEVDPTRREEPFVVRTLEAESGDRWIGNAICYGPHRDGQRPGGPSPSAAEIREDLHLMAPHWGLLRSYGSTEIGETLLALIEEENLDLKVVLGAWIGPDDTAANRREVTTAIRLANAYPEIVRAVSVGNETQVYWAAHRSSLDTLIAHVRHVRAHVTVPVTTADDIDYWILPESRRLADEVDFILMHAHPLWKGRQLDEALAWLRDQTSTVQALHPDRAIVIGETGWATAVHDQGEQAELIKGQAGEEEQKIFYEAVRAWSATERQVVFWFEAFDENWKGGPHPDEVEKHWGLFRADRTPKAALR